MSYRIYIIGSSCAGKTTLGRNLAPYINAKHIDLDDLHWLPNWQASKDDDFRRKLKGAIDDVDDWVITGSYSRTWDITMPHTTHIIFLDLPLWRLIARLFSRTFRRVVFKEKCCGGNTEKLGNFFSKDSLLLWQIKHFKTKRQRWQKMLRSPPNATVKFIHFKSAPTVDDVIQALDQESIENNV